MATSPDPLDPADPSSMCVHGNPNVLTFDRGTSRLAQGCSGQHTLVATKGGNSAATTVTLPAAGALLRNVTLTLAPSDGNNITCQTGSATR